MEHVHYIGNAALRPEEIGQLLEQGYKLLLSEESKKRIEDCRAFLERKVEKANTPFYGINTGFGALCNITVSGDELELLQHNLVRSHAAGTGEEVPEEIVRLMLFLKIQNLAYGFSGVRLELVERLTEFYNLGIHPVIYQLGSLGASGDLAPLAHLSLALLGEGEVNFGGKRLPAGEVLRQNGLQPLALRSKEGLALLNGTQFSNAYGLWALLHGRRLWRWANACAALSLDAFNGRYSPLHPAIHRIRPHAGQQKAAAEMLALLQGSEMGEQPKVSVQDPYAFRCAPQVHGASWTALDHAGQVITTELNSVTDNPNILEEEDAIISGGNFHAQPLALIMDYLAIALAELGNISERRVFQLLSGQRGLPAFLTVRAGLQSGLMIAQYTAAAIVSQNKQLSTPASVDSIVSSNGQEDHVSMAANAGTRLYRMVLNLERLLAIEWMSAAQAMGFRRPLRTSMNLENWLQPYRALVPPLIEDRPLSGDIEQTVQFMRSGTPEAL